MSSEAPCLDQVTVVAREGFCVAEAVGEAEACRRCHGRMGAVRRADDGYDVFVPCPRARLDRRIALFNAARIGARFAGATFDNYQPRTDTQRIALTKIRDFALMYPAVARGYLLWGPVGTGKTHLVTALFRELTLRKGVRCRFVDFGLLLQDIRRTFGADRAEPISFGELETAEVLLIDELGKGQLTPWELTVLDDLVGRRYNGNRVTMFTTNFEPREADRAPALNPAYAAREAASQRGRAETLADRMDARIFSRLCEMCDFVPVVGPDHRRDAPHR